MSMKRLIFDIEANNLMPRVNRIHCLSIMDADSGREFVFNDEFHTTAPIEQGLQMLDSADVIVGHNIINSVSYTHLTLPTKA